MTEDVREFVNKVCRFELRAHWPMRCIRYRRELIRHYVMLLRVREDRRPERIIPLYKKTIESMEVNPIAGDPRRVLSVFTGRGNDAAH